MLASNNNFNLNMIFYIEIIKLNCFYIEFFELNKSCFRFVKKKNLSLFYLFFSFIFFLVIIYTI